jgi:hypothetical protein
MKTKTIKMYCTVLERTVIADTAKNCSLSISEYCRRAVLSCRPRARLTEEQLELLKDVRKVAADLQHLNNFFKTGKFSDMKAENEKIITKLKSIIYDCNSTDN